jgi:hypothetical protein
MKMRNLILFVLFFALVVGTATAQDTATCDATQTFDDVGIALTAAQEAWANGDIEQMLSEMRTIEKLSAALHVACNGLTYTSEEYGVNAVIRDFSLEAGTYILHLEGAMTKIATTTLEGECGEYGLGINAYADRDSGYAEEVIVTADCTALLEVDGDESWVLTLEKIK